MDVRVEEGERGCKGGWSVGQEVGIRWIRGCRVSARTRAYARAHIGTRSLKFICIDFCI